MPFSLLLSEVKPLAARPFKVDLEFIFKLDLKSVFKGSKSCATLPWCVRLFCVLHLEVCVITKTHQVEREKYRNKFLLSQVHKTVKEIQDVLTVKRQSKNNINGDEAPVICGCLHT